MLIRLNSIYKHYETDAGVFVALNHIQLNIDSGEFVFVIGPSGSGKSTLLNLIAGLDRASAGAISVADTSLFDLNERELSRFRGQHIGIVFQFFQLLPTLTCAENIVLAMEFVGKIPKARRHKRALSLLDRVGVADQANKFPTMLSGGQQQRVAIARALANDPDLLIADEPTGNLDSASAAKVLTLFDELIKEKKAVIVVTHNREFAARGTRVVTLVDGEIS